MHEKNVIFIVFVAHKILFFAKTKLLRYKHFMNVYVVYVDKIFWNFGVIEFFVYLMIIAGKTIFLIRLVRVLDVLNNRADIGLNEFDKIN